MSFFAKPITALVTTVCVIGLLAGGTKWLLGSSQSTRAFEPPLKTTVSQNRFAAVASPNDLPVEVNLIASANEDLRSEIPARTLAVASESSISDSEGRPWDFQERSESTQRIEATLKRQSEIAFSDTALTEVVTFLSDYHDIPILIDNEALTEEGIAPDTPITRTLTGTKLESALNLMLAPLQLEYVIKNEVLMVTTIARATSAKEVLVYDLSRIPNIGPKTLSSIIMSVKPETWAEVGGGGTLILGSGFVAISQDQPTHRKIVTVLNQLERQAKRRTAK